MAKATKRVLTTRPISKGSTSECLEALYALEAQVGGAVALIGSEYRQDDSDGSLLQAVRLLNEATSMVDELRELIEPDVVERMAASVRVGPVGSHG